MHSDTALMEYDFHCPYCGSPLTFDIDPSQGSYTTWEDCHQCCAPIQVVVDVSPFSGELESVRTGSDDDVL
ncbi:CPXCG motif-containing cysteine-rich protein [Vreelandella jeotgali]|uniref:CPXCG motif-containing cysteine-rich protein n=1 Tax=Vreelandella jeotgali TaxID=553386 RepID=UPI00034D109A|nr:CPXCG motif-containing cysteine-rich protein [Halomonas jeotgali]